MISAVTKDDLKTGRVSPDQLFDSEAAAFFLGEVSVRTVYRLEKRGLLKCVWVNGRKKFRFKDLRAFARKGTR